jgi:hypothetical protein
MKSKEQHMLESPFQFIFWNNLNKKRSYENTYFSDNNTQIHF